MDAGPDKAQSLRAAQVLRATTGITCAYVRRHAIPAEALPHLIRVLHQALGHARDEPARETLKPAAPIGKSVQLDYIVCLEDGKRLKMLKRYLRAQYNMSPDEYRRRWALPADYPMVAPAYAAARSAFAKRIGLGRGVRRKT